MKHVHKYVVVKLGKRDVAKCSSPDCSHYTEIVLANGKESLCVYCDTKFRLTKSLLRLRKPHCGCRWSKTRAAREAAEKFGAVIDELDIPL